METKTEEKIPEEEQKFDLSPEQATSLDGGVPGLFNRKRVLIILCISFAVIIGGGLILNTLKSPKKRDAAVESGSSASSSSSQFLASLRDRAVNRRIESVESAETTAREQPEPLLPPVSFNSSPEVEAVRNPPRQPSTPAPAAPNQTPAPPAPARQTDPTYLRSSLVPSMQGSLFSQNAQTPQPASVPASYDAPRNAAPAAYGNSDYASQNDQQNKQSFLNSSASGGVVANGRFLGENALWAGTVIPGILLTAINTDLPGNVLARVTQNVYDSQTGRKLLIPQGTVLLARYNSSVSYAQRRVQIVWDTIIRPDGFQLDLDGANGVDRAGMSGQEAAYHENWFEYLKAAGIIALFSIANSKMTETAAQYATEESAANIAASGAQVVGQLGENIISRALNIQPRLTVDNGTVINIMLNKTLYLPTVNGYPAAQRYVLE